VSIFDKYESVFIVGNKRSGTSLLIQLLNLHPSIFISHESDIVWILYQLRNILVDEYKCYPLDSCTGMNATLKVAGHIINFIIRNRDDKPYQERLFRAFLGVEKFIMEGGSPVQPYYADKGEVRWIGDKKPVQQCDPEIRPFLYKTFPGARFLHIVRHPYAVVSSKIVYRTRNRPYDVPDFWYRTPFGIIEKWAEHEEWVLDMKRELGGEAVRTIRLEDLAANPLDEMDKAFSFLGTTMPHDFEANIEGKVRSDPNDKFKEFAYRSSDKAAGIMRLYSYGVA
jgi:hypothetical protein